MIVNLIMLILDNVEEFQELFQAAPDNFKSFVMPADVIFLYNPQA